MSIIIINEEPKVLSTNTNSGYYINYDTGRSWKNNFI